MPESLGHRAAKGAIWATIDRFGYMGIQFVVNIILARLLIPSDFGAIGMLTIFLAVSQTLLDGGFGSALIQKKKPTQEDYSTIFFWNIVFSILLYIIIFILAPLIGKFYSMPILSKILRVIGLNLIITSVLAIQTTRLRKELAFQTIAITNLSALIIGASIAIVMALSNCGVWSIVGMQLSQSTMAIILLWITTRWHPSYYFSKKTLKELFSFGGFIMAANILQTISQNLQGIIIGKRFSANQMGYFSQAYKLEQVISYSIPQVIVQVMYPVYSSVQDEKERLNNMVLLSLRVVAFVIFPLLIFLILISEPLIIFLYGEKWLKSVPYFRILCVGGFFECLQNINFYAVAAVGKSKALFKISFYKWGFLLTALLIGMNFGMNGILWGMVLSSLNIFLINAYLASRHIGLRMSLQLGSILPIFLIVIISLIFGWSITIFNENILVTSISFLICFYSISKIIRLRALHDTLEVAQKMIKQSK